MGKSHRVLTVLTSNELVLALWATNDCAKFLSESPETASEQHSKYPKQHSK